MSLTHEQMLLEVDYMRHCQLTSQTYHSEMYTIKGIILDVSIDALHYFSYNNQMTVLFLHCTL